MRDEEWLFHSDRREKSSIARSARNKRTHNGKRGGVKFPSDYMTKKEIEKMNGKVESYRLNEPMTWSEFKKLPDDIKVMYIKALREKFNCFDSAIADMMGINKCSFSNEIKRLGLGHGTKHGGNKTWNEREAFWAWAKGVKMSSNAPVAEEEPIPECPVEEEQSLGIIEMTKKQFEEIFRKPEKVAIPNTGNMVFEGRTEEILKTVAAILGGANVHISIAWDVVSE